MELISLTIPCYNEAARLQPGHFIRFLDDHPQMRLCLVDDGSSDGTWQVLERIRAERPDQVLTHRMEKNQGKAEAVRSGITRTLAAWNPAFCGYFDADLSTPLEESLYLQAHFASRPELELCFGSRFNRAGSTINRRLHRHVFGRVVATAISQLLGLAIYDTQCGAKLFRSSLAKKVFREPFLSRWLFDVEIFQRILREYGRKGTLERILEVPLNHWEHKDGSKISAWYAFRMIIDLYQIRRRYKKNKTGG